MARPEYLEDIEMNNIEFATIELDKINLDPALLRGYTAFLEAATKAGAEVDSGPYRGVRFLRYPNMTEQEDQLRTAQNTWDYGKKQYDLLASVGEVEHSWDRTRAEEWAKNEDMPFPPPHDPISDFHATIAAIDEVTA
jgi:hypothetical protein